MSAERPCPACAEAAGADFVEEHLDPIGGGRYRLLLCRGCGVVFSEPREAVGADWYEKAAPLRAREARARGAGVDWRYERFLAEGLPPGRLLDVGCGGGDFLLLAQARGFSVAGVDYDRRMVELALARGVADAECAGLHEFCARRAAAELDYATLFDVLEHLPEPRRLALELRRLLRPGGYLAVTLPNAERPLPWRREEHDYPPHHFTRWTPIALRGFLERCGFETVRQDVSRVRLRYLADHAFYYGLAPGPLRLVKRMLFGRQAGTISELYAAAPGGSSPLRGALSDKLTRQKLADAAKAACSLVTYPTALAQMAWYAAARRRGGDCLYTLARRKPATRA
ncbi:MAG: class I SAM-dependent methyltransferase [Elusimicrobia bacterium]|nr:class I SAM-dependent methyltransferase [Elusimicrobiota bacterium]MDE2424414.1 class I SAM-dependent methyltransferase [Elusimicrobiota bacterium]